MRVKSFARAAIGLLLPLGLSACMMGSGLLSARDTLIENRPFEPGGLLTLENVNGRVTVGTWSEPRVRIEADKAASSESALKRLKVEIEGEGRRVDVHTRMPGGWLFGGGRVEYRITLPAEASVRVHTVNGSVEIQGVGGELRASTTNGSVEVTEAAGEVQASTVNGGIQARYRTANSDGRHRFSTTNGSITVFLPDGAGGRLDAGTVNGGIHSDLPLESTDRATRHRLVGRLGKGRGSLELSTVNGTIRLHRG
jgi:hypothetical protein